MGPFSRDYGTQQSNVRFLPRTATYILRNKWTILVRSSYTVTTSAWVTFLTSPPRVFVSKNMFSRQYHILKVPHLRYRILWCLAYVFCKNYLYMQYLINCTICGSNEFVGRVSPVTFLSTHDLNDLSCKGLIWKDRVCKVGRSYGEGWEGRGNWLITPFSVCVS